jgi:hypothetical protein
MKLLQRADLIDITQQYLDAVIHHTPERAPLHPLLRSTQNCEEIRLGEGHWLNIERFAGEQFFVDTFARQVIVMGAAYHDDRPWPWSLRLHLESGLVIESETVISTDAKGHFADVEELLIPDVLYDAPVPPDRRVDRNGLRNAADSYWEGLQTHNGHWPRFHYRCDKYDNGAKTTNVLRTLLSPDATVHSCGSSLNNASQARPRARERRYPVLDVELGVAGSMVCIDFHPVPHSPRPDEGTFYMMGVFKVVDGQLRIIDEIREIMPLGAQSGW